MFLDRHAPPVRQACARAAGDDPADGLLALRATVRRARAAGASVAVAAHNRANADGLDINEITTMTERIGAALGPVDLWCVCPIAPDGTCGCGEHGHGLVADGARAVGLPPERCVVVTDDVRLHRSASVAGAAVVPAGRPDLATGLVETICATLR